MNPWRSALWSLALVIGAGCGRDHFDRVVDAAPNDGLFDTPPLPALVCSMVTTAIPPVAAGAELAVFANHTSTGYYAAWAKDGPVSGLAFDAKLAPLAEPRVIIPDSARGVAGLVDTGTKVLIATDLVGPSQAVWALSQTLTGATLLRTERSLASREPFASDVALAPRVWVRSTGTNLVGSFVRDDGTIEVENRRIAGNQITAVSLEDGPDHSHIAWSETLSDGKTQCLASDVDYQGPDAALPAGARVFAPDCQGVRTSSGPLQDDTMIAVSTTAAHRVEARYLTGGGDFLHTVSPNGRAPKVRFDGTVFWVAWIEEGASDELHLATLDLAGRIKEVGLPGWKPVGDEAFQLVRRGAAVHLAVLSAGAISFLAACP